MNNFNFLVTKKYAAFRAFSGEIPDNTLQRKKNLLSYNFNDTKFQVGNVCFLLIDE